MLLRKTILTVAIGLVAASAHAVDVFIIDSKGTASDSGVLVWGGGSYNSYQMQAVYSFGAYTSISAYTFMGDGVTTYSYAQSGSTIHTVGDTTTIGMSLTTDDSITGPSTKPRGLTADAISYASQEFEFEVFNTTTIDLAWTDNDNIQNNGSFLWIFDEDSGDTFKLKGATGSESLTLGPDRYQFLSSLNDQLNQGSGYNVTTDYSSNVTFSFTNPVSGVPAPAAALPFLAGLLRRKRKS